MVPVLSRYPTVCPIKISSRRIPITSGFAVSSPILACSVPQHPATNFNELNKTNFLMIIDFLWHSKNHQNGQQLTHHPNSVMHLCRSRMVQDFSEIIVVPLKDNL